MRAGSRGKGMSLGATKSLGEAGVPGSGSPSPALFPQVHRDYLQGKLLVSTQHQVEALLAPLAALQHLSREISNLPSEYEPQRAKNVPTSTRGATPNASFSFNTP